MFFSAPKTRTSMRKKTCFALLLASLFLLSCSVLYTWKAFQLYLPERSFRTESVGSWIERNPDIAQSVRVVHLVRDPRAIYSSRRGLRWCTNYKPCDSAAALCDQMRSDLDAFRELTRRLQINRTYQIRFEDLAADPLNETMRVFGSLGLNYAPSVSKYIETHTVAAAAEMRDAHSTKRNSKTVVHMWKTKLSMQKIREIETTCGDVLQRLGYKSVPK
ncbi:carbohydrate sulfotransferase 4-like isoform X8 [Dermacentor variabilis]|uniref:carbohydrate sulfotransferase 4-like isoform X8 n=1 Tax=Dermacentor variabilis TaxID=34621 RepID=UPI003F5BF349